ncbi:MbtH family protein [Streptomyces oryzae]|uniref:MbtH family protein n=1 Tax=Streptomyces oryzae TaxID=1434886 RepID=A0ABS3XD16_9ACTN|nr:MbtH family protein [Streptomyces oryzae]
MTNPFEDQEAEYLVLINDEHQYSLWPAAIAVPDGWSVVHGKDTRQACLDHVEQHWTDMRPKSLAEAMAAADSATPPETGGPHSQEPPEVTSGV